jgi:hypothetical protein
VEKRTFAPAAQQCRDGATGPQEKKKKIFILFYPLSLFTQSQLRYQDTKLWFRRGRTFDPRK